MQKLSRSLIALGGLAALAACGDDVSIAAPTPTPVAVVGVTVSPAALNLKVGESATLGVSVETTGGAATTVTWTSSTPTVASVSATGAVTAVAAGNTTVRATSTADASKSGAAQVTVTAPAVRSVTVSPAALSLQVGQTATAVATVDRDAGVAGTVSWATNNAAVASVNATSGLITAASQGTAVITATSTADNTKSAALAVTVVAVPNNLTALSVAPTSANLGVGSTLQLVPSATTVGTPTVTYTYASSNTSVVTVSATGLVTAVGNGTAVVTTTATTNTNSLSVSTTIGVASASVSISTITAGGLGVPVNIANVAGQIEVTMNISAGNQTLDSVRVKLGSKSAASQAFTVNGAPNAPVTLSINTAAYIINADSTSTVSFLNGATGVQAELFVQGASGPTASNTITIILNNLDTFHARWTLPTTSAISAGGLQWYGGPGTSTTVNAIPVMYSGNTITSATIHLDDQTVFGNDAPCGTVTDASGPFTGTFSCAGVTNPNIQPAVLASLRGDGNPGPANTWAFFGPSSSGPRNANGQIMQQQSQIPVRIDVAGPGTATYQFVAATTNDYWANAAFRHDSSFSGLLARSRAVDGGVGTAAASTDVYEYEDRAVSGTTWTTHAANTTNIPENPVDFTVNAYNGRVTEKDLLGNASITYLGSTSTSPGTQNFGVDVTAPSLDYLTATVGSGEPRILLPALDTLGNTKVLSNQGNVAGTIRADSGYFGVRYRDTRSGFGTTIGAEPQRIKITRLAASGPTCIVGVGSSCASALRLGAVDVNDNTYRRDTASVYGTGINASGGTTGRVNALYPTATNSDSAGYYTYETSVRDRAGNTSATITKTVAVDVATPLITGIGFPAILTGGSSVAFVPNATDELEVLDGALGLKYPGMTGPDGAGADTLYFPRAFFADYKSPFSGAPLSSVVGGLAPFGAAGLTLPISFLRGVDSVATADSLAPVANAVTYKPTTVVAHVFDIRAYTPSSIVYTTPPFESAFFGAAILPGQVPAGLPITSMGAGGKWFVFGVGTTGGAIQARALTSTVITNPPFPQVGFFRYSTVGTAGRWVYLGKVDAVPGTNPTIFDQGSNRFWTYTLSGVSPAVAAADVIRAVGMTTAGDGLSTGSCVKGPNC